MKLSKAGIQFKLYLAVRLRNCLHLPPLMFMINKEPLIDRIYHDKDLLEGCADNTVNMPCERDGGLGLALQNNSEYKRPHFSSTCTVGEVSVSWREERHSGGWVQSSL